MRHGGDSSFPNICMCVCVGAADSQATVLRFLLAFKLQNVSLTMTTWDWWCCQGFTLSFSSNISSISRIQRHWLNLHVLTLTGDTLKASPVCKVICTLPIFAPCNFPALFQVEEEDNSTDWLLTRLHLQHAWLLMSWSYTNMDLVKEYFKALQTAKVF